MKQENCCRPFYVIVRKDDGLPVRFGMNGGDDYGYCMNRGNVCAFTSLAHAKDDIRHFTKPEDFEVIELVRKNA